MEENTTISRSEQSSLLTSATEDEIFVAQILLDLPNMIQMLDSGPGFKWGSKKRRSGLGDAPPSMSPSSQKTAVEIEERQPQPKAITAAEVAATASPVTPLAFSPSESDEKSKHALKRSSRKKSREDYIGTIEELTQRRDLLKKEIQNVTKYRNKLIAYNSELKTMKKQVLNSRQREEESEMEVSRERNLGLELTQNHRPYHESWVEKPQPLVADQMAEKVQNSIGPITAHLHSSSCNGLGSVNHLGPIGIPDLNVSAEEAFEEDQPQPLDMSRDRRTRFAEARRRRMDIIKIKSMRNASCGIKFSTTR